MRPVGPPGEAEVGAALVGHELVRKVAFTGGAAGGRAVAALAGDRLTPSVMELGGNDPAVFLDDAEFSDDAMDRLVMASFATSGQVCMAAKRLYVPVTRLAEFVTAVREGSVPASEVHRNVMSLAMVEGAVRSARTGERAFLADLLDEAYEQALATERRPDLRAALAAWPSVHEVIGGSTPTIPHGPWNVGAR